MGTDMMLAPGQPLRALERANEVRLARAQLKRAVAAGICQVADIVLECPWEAESMTVSELLMSQSRWGRARCRRLLVSIDMAEGKRLEALTDRQRHCLAAVLRARPDHSRARSRTAGERASAPARPLSNGRRGRRTGAGNDAAGARSTA